ncbi:MAG TPA: diphthine--ammonia ligase [Ferruginibacter sp.]|nr:diphthine--ammonia ligase [Ferruginibacter sp.]HPH93228.1 diphthine--ammonia ligase [Ferruginibacter sp.]
MIKAYMNWSGGKDSALALYKILQQQQYEVGCLLTSVNTVHNRISMHGVRRELLEAQAESIGLTLTTVELPEQPSMEDYENLLQEKVTTLKEQQFTHSIFGDIFLEDLRKYREDQLDKAGITGVFPLWKVDTKELMQEFWQLGFKTIIVCVNERFLDKSFCGRVIDEQCIKDFPANVDVCGENGEFHSFVFAGPLFKQPIAFTKGELVYKEYAAPKTGDAGKGDTIGFWFADLIKG